MSHDELEKKLDFDDKLRGKRKEKKKTNRGLKNIRRMTDGEKREEKERQKLGSARTGNEWEAAEVKRKGG